MYDEEGQKNTFTYDASGNKKSETDEKEIQNYMITTKIIY